MKNFEQFLSQLKPTIADYKYFTDFDKVLRNVYKIDREINQLNEVLNSLEVKEDLLRAIRTNPMVYKMIPMLIANRNTEINIYDGRDIKIDFKELPDNSFDDFITNTGILDLFQNNIISNFRDYLIGVEVGLDSNARKNRTGKTMENIVEDFIDELQVEYFSQIKFSSLVKKGLIDSTYDSKDTAEKVFDFSFVKNDILYLVETNFYGSNGSKLNETARSYIELNKRINKIPNAQFIWITDGVGWNYASKNLSEAYLQISNLFNLTDLESGSLKEL